MVNSHEAWEVNVDADTDDEWGDAPDPTDTSPWPIRGTPADGTHGVLALTPREHLAIHVRRPLAVAERAPRYQLRGGVAWNLDAGVQQVAAELAVRILGGRTDRIDLALPTAADRVRVTGPDVRDAQRTGDTMHVFLRGRIGERTRLSLRYELPAPAGGRARLVGPAVSDGYWMGGSLVVTNTAGGTEVLTASSPGLTESAVSDVPRGVAAILAGPPVVAFQITGRRWSAEVEVVNLGEFALRESIADLAHYEVMVTDDGIMLCRATYEMRNRTRQFARVRLSPGAVVLQVRVNDKPQPFSAVEDAPGTFLLPLVRSKASVKGLVSFPVEIVLMRRVAPPAEGADLAVPLPQLDVPIAYAWCEAHVPRAMDVGRWSGPLQRVDRYSHQTATSHLGYGVGEAAGGYAVEDRPVPLLGEVPLLTTPMMAPRPSAKGVTAARSKAIVSQRLAENYWRAGEKAYEQGDYDKAVASLEQAAKLGKGTPVATNAERLLSNIQLLRKKLTVKGGQQKAAAARVQREVDEANVELRQKQQKIIQRVQTATEKGRTEEAGVLLEAAEALGKQLVQRGEDEKAQTSRLRQVRKTVGQLRGQGRRVLLAGHPDTGRQERIARIDALLEKWNALMAKRQYADAVAVAKKALAVDPDSVPAQTALWKATKQQKVVRGRASTLDSKQPVYEVIRSGMESNIGRPAKPQVVTPDAREWEGLTQRRQKYRVVDLSVRSPKTLAIEQRLAKPVTFDFSDATLADVVDFLRDFTGVNIVLDTPALEEEGIGSSTAVNMKLAGVSLRSALRLILDPIGLTYLVKDDVIVITSQTQVAGELRTRVYPVADLVVAGPGPRDGGAGAGFGGGGGRGGADDDDDDDDSGGDDDSAGDAGAAGLRDLLESVIAPNAWDAVGGPGSVQYSRNGNALIVSQTAAVHEQVTDLLTRLRRSRTPDADEPARPAWQQEIDRKLNRPVTSDFRGRTLADVVEFLRDYTGLNIVLDAPALEEEGIARDVKINVRLAGVSLRSALRRITDPLGLTYLVKDEVVLVTSRTKMAGELRTHVYPVADLVVTTQPARPGSDAVEELRDVVEAVIAPNSWDTVGGPGSVQYFGGAKVVVVSQTPDVHEQVRDLLGQLRAVPDVTDGGPTPERHEREIEAKLNTPVTVEVRGVALGAAVELLRQRTGVNITLDLPALAEEGISPKAKVSGRFRDEALKSALRRLVHPLGLTVLVKDEAVWVTTPTCVAGELTTRVYPVGDLVAMMRGATRGIVHGTPPVRIDRGDAYDDGDDDDDDGDDADPGADGLLSLIELDVEPNSWDTVGGPGCVQYFANRKALIVSQTPDHHEAIAALFARLRRSARPQVEQGTYLALQRAGGVMGEARRADDYAVSAEGFDRLVDRNYAWSHRLARTGGPLERTPEAHRRELALQLRLNLGQKVSVNSVNLNADQAVAGALGVAFRTGKNGLRYAEVDEGQLRTLLEMHAAQARRPMPTSVADRFQETIVGTDAWLANGMAAHVAFARDRTNRLTIQDNEIELAHEKYVLIDNGGYLTAVRAGAMQHWTQRAEPLVFAEVVERITVPRVGRLVKFEKRLVEPGDHLVIRAAYTWKGVAR